MNKQSLFLTLQNNTAGTIPVFLLRNSNPNSNIANARTRYAWNVTGQTYTLKTFSIQAKFSAAASFETYSGTLAASSLNALLAALNALNIGAFWSETTGLNTYLVTWNDNVIYNNLVVDTPTPATTSLDWINATTLPGGALFIDVNAINVVTSNNPGINVGGTIAPLAPGDAIDINVQASPGEPTPFIVQQILAYAPFTVTTLKNVIVPGAGTDNYSFNIDTNYIYSVTWGLP